MFYLTLKVIHIFSVISWMVVLLYLPRLFVYHQKHIDKEEVGTVFKVMETNLIRIGHVAFIATWLSGGFLISYSGMGEWLIIKIFLVLLMTFLYGFFILSAQNFKLNRNKRSELFFRICLLYTSPSPRDLSTSRMPSSA